MTAYNKLTIQLQSERSLIEFHMNKCSSKCYSCPFKIKDLQLLKDMGRPDLSRFLTLYFAITTCRRRLPSNSPGYPSFPTVCPLPPHAFLPPSQFFLLSVGPSAFCFTSPTSPDGVSNGIFNPYSANGLIDLMVRHLLHISNPRISLRRQEKHLRRTLRQIRLQDDRDPRHLHDILDTLPTFISQFQHFQIFLLVVPQLRFSRSFDALLPVTIG